MAEEKITANEFIDPSIRKEFEALNKEVQTLIKNTTQLLGSMKPLYEEMKKGATTQKEVADNVKKTDDNTKKLSDVEKEIQKIEEKHYQVLTKMVATRSEENKKLQEATEKAKNENKERKENVKISQAQNLSLLALNGSYKQIQAALSANILKYQSLTKEQRENSKVGGELVKTIQNQDKALKNLDSNIGKYGRNVGNYKSALSSLTTAFGITGGLYAFANVLKSGFNEIKTFDYAMSELKSVAGATNEEFIQLRNSALELGRTTPKTATDVAKLQTEFAKLGFTTPEILKVTAATIDLSVATGSDLATAATNAGSTLRAFQLPASEMPRILDVMAKGFATTALDIGNYNEAIKYVAPVAKAAGFSIEEVTAMLGKLSDAGIKGSMAGTGLRRIFLEVAKSGGDPKKAFDELAKSGLGLAEANDEVGDRAQTALLVLSAQKKEVEKLTESYQNAKGSLKEMADIMQDNLTGDVTKATAAWSGFILGLDSGNGVITKTSRYLVQLWTTFVSDLRSANVSFMDMVNNIISISDKNKTYILSGDISEIDKFGGKSFLETQKTVIKAREDDLKLQREQLALYNLGANKMEEKDVVEIQNLIEKIEWEKLRLSEAEKYIKSKEKESKTAIFITEDEQKKLNKIKDEENKNDLAILKEKWKKMGDFYAKNEKDVKKQAKVNEDIQDESLKNFLDRKKSEEDADKRAWKKKKKILEAEKEANKEIHNLKVSTANQFVDLGISLGDRAISDIEARKEKEIASAGDNAKRKERIEADAAKRIAAIKRKQAIADKAMSLFNIFNSTRMAVMAIMAQLFVPFAVKTTQATWTRILGGIQAAAVLAEPIPKFFKGVKGLKNDTLGIVGDKAPGKGGDSFELIDTPKGTFLSPNQATAMALPKGTTVYTHEETIKMMGGMQPEMVHQLIKEQRLTRKALANQTHNSTTLTQDGLEYARIKGNSRTKMIDKYFRI